MCLLRILPKLKTTTKTLKNLLETDNFGSGLRAGDRVLANWISKEIRL